MFGLALILDLIYILTDYLRKTGEMVPTDSVAECRQFTLCDDSTTDSKENGHFAVTGAFESGLPFKPFYNGLPITY
jgi:hypothetical protein